MKDVPVILKTLGVVMGIVAGMISMGLLMAPGSAATKDEVVELDRGNQKEHSSIQQSLVRVETKLDMIIEKLGGK